MPRAKRTNRTDARRRHRAQLAAEAAEAAEDPVLTDEGTQPQRPAAQGAPTKPASGTRRATARRDELTPPRPAPAGGLRNAFRLAFRPVNVREDLRLLPRLIVHKAFWVPLLITLVVAGAVIAFQGRELITRYALQYFVFPPPIGTIFLAGFLAPRASYLLGALVGVVSSLVLAVTVATVPALFPGVSATDAGLSALVTSPMAGIFFGSAAAWYRRFLYLASPARQMERRPPAQRGKPARGR